jgi:hypothetical protein
VSRAGSGGQEQRHEAPISRRPRWSKPSCSTQEPRGVVDAEAGGDGSWSCVTLDVNVRAMVEEAIVATTQEQRR